MLNTLTLTQAIQGLKKKDFSSVELAAAVTQSITDGNTELNIYLNTSDVLSEEVIASHDTPLAGAPIAIKDNISTQKLPTTASSLVLEEYYSPYEATVVTKLQKAGGVIVGKTNLDAWAHGSSTETSQFGRTLNPRNPAHLPGGSSGGSAAAVAADMCLAALGTETAGSIRQPAAWCGVVGLKPTYGRVSRYGVVAMASSTDSPGPIAKTVADSAVLLNHIAGHDPKDGTTSAEKIPDFTASLGKDIKGLKIGVIYADLPGLESSKAALDEAAKVLEELGAEVEYAEALDPNHAVSVYTVIQRGEVSSNLARYDGIRFGKDRSFFGAEAQRRIMLGTYTLAKGYADQYYTLAQKVRTLFIQDFQRLFSKYDVLISLTSPGYAKKIGASEGSAMFGELEDMLVEPSSITGLPGISVPCAHDPASNLFLGLNIMAPMWREDVVIQVGDAYERATSWNTWRNLHAQ
ncbi:MAG: aspartyl/glutamyl-tRNA amidotransferase subunit A [bacterium]|nr:aspartyl/glutamyl-tRNA amidotransferase subunit A [bacterium]